MTRAVVPDQCTEAMRAEGEELARAMIDAKVPIDVGMIYAVMVARHLADRAEMMGDPPADNGVVACDLAADLIADAFILGKEDAGGYDEQLDALARHATLPPIIAGTMFSREFVVDRFEAVARGWDKAADRDKHPRRAAGRHLCSTELRANLKRLVEETAR